jgi:hypothetical protein
VDKLKLQALQSSRSNEENIGTELLDNKENW